ncbi:MAG: hypothetical protein EHM48_00680, partial [Planctomycetaceae bacterium]
MAKANTSKMIEQHVEKAVAGFCGLILLYALFHWGFSSSDEIEIATYPGNVSAFYTPGQLDGVLAQQTDTVRKAIDSAKSDVPKVPDYAAAVKTAMATPMPNAIVGLAIYGPPLPPIGVITEDKSSTPTLAELTAGTVPPSHPSIISRRVLVRLDQPEDRSVVNGVCVFPYGQVLGTWTDKLKAARISPAIVAAGQEVERQELSADGTWGKSEIIKLAPKPLMDAQGKESALPNIPAFDGANYQPVLQEVEKYKNPEWQKQILQPQYPDVYWAAQKQWVDWRVFLTPT